MDPDFQRAQPALDSLISSQQPLEEGSLLVLLLRSASTLLPRSSAKKEVAARAVSAVADATDLLTRTSFLLYLLGLLLVDVRTVEMEGRSAAENVLLSSESVLVLESNLQTQQPELLRTIRIIVELSPG